MCRDLLRLHWSRPNLQVYGKRGEDQSGVDILDLGGTEPLAAAQCKLKEEHKSLAPQEIGDEVDKAKGFELPIGKYAILTTGKVSTQAQLKVREINHAHIRDALFEVELFTWETICELLQRAWRSSVLGGKGVGRLCVASRQAGTPFRLIRDLRLTDVRRFGQETRRRCGVLPPAQPWPARAHPRKRKFQPLGLSA
jgi:hypothetical protein